jgi:hypothetical protein
MFWDTKQAHRRTSRRLWFPYYTFTLWIGSINVWGFWVSSWENSLICNINYFFLTDICFLIWRWIHNASHDNFWDSTYTKMLLSGLIYHSGMYPVILAILFPLRPLSGPLYPPPTPTATRPEVYTTESSWPCSFHLSLGWNMGHGNQAFREGTRICSNGKYSHTAFTKCINWQNP